MFIVFVIGFDLFENEFINLLWEVVCIFDGQGIVGVDIVVCQLLIIFGEFNKVFGKLLQMLQLDVVIVVGQVGGCVEMVIECIVINVDDVCIVDNVGKQFIDIVIVSDGLVVYFLMLLIKVIVCELCVGGVFVLVLQMVGIFVCNYVFYGLMYVIVCYKLFMCGGFIYILYLLLQVVKYLG